MIETWVNRVTALGCIIAVGCATGDSTGEQPSLGGDDGSSDAAFSSGASSGSVSSGTSSGGVAASGAVSASTSSTGAASGGGTASDSASASGSPSGASSGAAPSGGTSSGVTASGGASSGLAGSGATGDGGSACGAGLLYPVSATASSVEELLDASPGSLVAANAIDHNLSTRWESRFQVDPSWIEVDFGFPVYFSEVDVLWQSACARVYDLDVSNDATTWTSLKSLTTNPIVWQNAPSDWTNDDVEKISGVGRYLRIYGTMRCQAEYGYSIWEIRAFGDMNAGCTP